MAAQPILDGVLGVNQARVTSGNALVVAASTSAPLNSAIVDSLGLYIETRDVVSSILAVTATSTSTQTGADQTNTLPGALFHISFVSVVATSTVRVMIQAKDPISGRYAIMASVSIDGISVTTTGNLNQLLYVYPGAVSPGGTATAVGVSLSRIFRVIASITVINATTTSAVALNVGMTPLM